MERQDSTDTFAVMWQWDGGRLTEGQRSIVRSWLGTSELISDLSWGQTDTKVLHVRTGEGMVIIKASSPGHRHISREISAHGYYTRPLIAEGLAARVLYSSRVRNIFVLK